ncbi:peptidoglycan glycosyltransferase [Desulfonatronum thiosulfatophilum]|uniref:Peptidoglycan glycosyltransferase n=1 Tax=Desulfonatronum thiosulfatophilum TaxID=617002 RepID=A0A1G6C2Y3_9BACT|nr:penicillin-binding protein 2 [Desulfonatronum thiosulfatophilum]SDB27233.1 peptidoglycan glycosyltransferase [Desulfonatronum thiosulfatophilum]
MNLSRDADQQFPRNGLLFLQLLVLGLFLIFILRFWYLQLHKGQDFADRAENNRIRHQLVYAPRGLIRDRNGTLLSVNEPAYALAIVREDSRDIPEVLRQVAIWLDMDPESIRETFEKGRLRIRRFEPQILVHSLTFEQLATIEANTLVWPELKIITKPRRTYLDGPLLAHVIGYVAEANEQEMNADPELNLGDSIGKKGMEFTMESVLRGKKGLRQMDVDAAGRQLGTTLLTPPQAGNDIRLSIDLELQRYVDAQMGDHVGSVIVLEADTGQILALVSKPAFDNNLFVTSLSHADWAVLRDNPAHPLQNRAIQSAYPPGSVFKLVIAGAALTERTAVPSDRVFCSGGLRLGNRLFRCWERRGHGWMDMNRGLVQSCDTYFYTLGDKLGVDRMHPYSVQSGFGVRTGIDLPHESSGLVPSREWKRRRFNEPWHRGENFNMSIGQGFMLTTPIQVARYNAALINGGKLLKPQLLADADPEVQSELPLQASHRDFLVQTMVNTVEDGRGTARRISRPDVRLGAKTGTAQVVRLMAEYEKAKLQDIPYHLRDHAWMTSFGQKDGRSYVIVAMIEHGGGGGSTAGPIIKTIYDYLFPKDQFHDAG